MGTSVETALDDVNITKLKGTIKNQEIKYSFILEPPFY